MTAKKWSISGLATEIGIDRRTVARVINEQNIQEAGEVHGAPVYRMKAFLDGWTADIKATAALPEQKVLWDLLGEAMRTMADMSGVSRRK